MDFKSFVFFQLLVELKAGMSLGLGTDAVGRYCSFGTWGLDLGLDYPGPKIERTKKVHPIYNCMRDRKVRTHYCRFFSCLETASTL